MQNSQRESIHKSQRPCIYGRIQGPEVLLNMFQEVIRNVTERLFETKLTNTAWQHKQTAGHLTNNRFQGHFFLLLFISYYYQNSLFNNNSTSNNDNTSAFE